MTDIFTPPKPPAVNGFRASQKAGVNRTQFGDGYSQRSPSGINAQPRVVQMTLKNLSALERDTVLNFFRIRAGIAPFYYMPPNENSLILWSCDQWRERPSKNKLDWDVLFALKQEFDLDA